MKKTFAAFVTTVVLGFVVLLSCLVLGVAPLRFVGTGAVARAQETPPVPVVDKAAEKLLADKAMQNARTVCTTCLMKAADENGVFKIQAATFKNDVGIYANDKNVFTSPLDKPGTASFQFNKTLQNVPQNKIKHPDQTVMVYEGQWGKPLFRYNGRAIIGFAEGHAKWVTPAQAKGLLWKP